MKEDKNKFEIEDLFDGRWALKKNGLVIKVAYSKSELEKYLLNNNSKPLNNHIGPYWRKRK